MSVSTKVKIIAESASYLCRKFDETRGSFESGAFKRAKAQHWAAEELANGRVLSESAKKAVDQCHVDWNDLVDRLRSRGPKFQDGVADVPGE